MDLDLFYLDLFYLFCSVLLLWRHYFQDALLHYSSSTVTCKARIINSMKYLKEKYSISFTAPFSFIELIKMTSRINLFFTTNLRSGHSNILTNIHSQGKLKKSVLVSWGRKKTGKLFSITDYGALWSPPLAVQGFSLFR